MIFLVLLVIGALSFILTGVAPVALDARRAQQTNDQLAQARDALVGYALQYREDQIAQGQPDRVYGYLPLPDLGSTRNNNAGCAMEGCDAANFSGNALNTTVIGRLPWRTLGLPPLRDGHGECLWYALSGSHQRQQRITPMNWDTLAHLDIVVADGSAALAAALASAHERPVAVIFSPGPPLGSQNRSDSASDDVTQCGGNYDAMNYLDPGTVGALGSVSNYLSGATNNASAVTSSASPKALTVRGRIFTAGSSYKPDSCTAGNCTLVANDIGLAVTGDALFGSVRRHAYFRADINSMLDRMALCLRDKIASGVGFTPAAIPGFTPPADKSAGFIPDDACYDDTQPPKGYYSHYKEMLFVARPNSGNFTVNTDTDCAGVLLFAGQRGTGQLRDTAARKNTPSNFLEGANLSSFTAAGTTFAGDTQFQRSPAQAAGQDIVRCIPSSASFTPVSSPVLAGLGIEQLVAYDPATRTLTLGQSAADLTGAPASALFGCAWLPEVRTLGSGLRTYFRFQFKKVGTSVGSSGFVFAIADAVQNGLTACGAAGNHLGYSGNNGSTPKITYPKIGIEFDQGRNSGFSETATTPGRNDPCGASGCGGTVGYDSHAAIVYWGHESANATDGVTLPDNDDNAHGFPSAGSLPGAQRPPPRSHSSPTTETGIKFVNMRGYPTSSFDSRTFHVRVELTPTRNANGGAAELSNTSILANVWIEGDASLTDQIAALKDTTRPMSLLYPSYAATLSNTAILYDVPVAACSSGTCPYGQSCGTDNYCYRPALETIQLGFTGAQRASSASDQEVPINEFFATWLP